jgi:hypothetical protein
MYGDITGMYIDAGNTVTSLQMNENSVDMFSILIVHVVPPYYIHGYGRRVMWRPYSHL